MEQPISKSRTPSRCREWEKNRRNKFNEAINRLGEVMKEVNKANSASTNETDNVQLPKVEIVEKAILYMRNFLQETKQLKADIMALQIKIVSFSKQTLDKKDASTQVFIGINKKKNSKYVKVLMLRKSKRRALKEKSNLTADTTVSATTQNSAVEVHLKNIAPKILPTLLPNKKGKKGTDGTIVVLPAPSYILPQRPLLFPTAPPAFVILDSNVQTLNKPAFPIVNRNNGDITKTTMVNILPISAYSAPVSGSKVKKNNGKSKLKSNVAKKSTKTPSKNVIVTKENTNNKKRVDDIVNDSEAIETSKTTESSKPNLAANQSTCSILPATNNVLTAKEGSPAELSALKETNNEISKENEDKISKTSLEKLKYEPKMSNVFKEVEPKKLIQTEKVPVEISHFEVAIKQVKSKSENLPQEKHVLDKNKENKTPPSMMHDSLCENVVDGGNARLELAEEFLAASPTAAFLMSFPLVSGNRADSPAEEQSNISLDSSNKIIELKRSDVTNQTITQTYFEKPTHNITKYKSPEKLNTATTISHDQNKLASQKYSNNTATTMSKQIESKCSNIAVTTIPSENPFLSLPSLLPTSCTLNDSTFSLDFDCHLNKSIASQPTSYPSSSNIFYKSDPFSSVKNTIYSTSNISSGHEFNSFGLYPCAMEKYSSKNKSEYSNVEENLMKIGTSRLTYDIDLGWSHKGFDFVNCSTAPNTFSKDNILTTVASGPYSSSYNPFNPEFHIPLMTNSSKKDNPIKSTSSFPEAVTSLYSQPPNLWSEDVPFFTNTNVSKSFPIKNNFINSEPTYTKPNILKQYETKPNHDICVDNSIKPVSHNMGHSTSEKYTKKSQSKMHINWMTSETRPIQPNYIPPLADVKETHKPSYNTVALRQYNKKQDHNDGNYFPISMSNFSSQPIQEDLQTWPASRPAGTTEISIEPPPINLPTLVGDLALGPHDKKKSIEAANRASHPDIQNCSNFFSVTQLMNRTTDNSVPSRYHAPNVEPTKSLPPKHTSLDNRKTMIRPDTQLPQPCYGFRDSKNANYEMMSQYSQPQSKSKTIKSDKSSKTNKNSYSAESLIRGGTCTQKLPDSNSTKFLMQPTQKYNDYNAPQDSSVAQVSHFPAILDYSENNYAGQQFSGTTLYNSTSNTISNSFYSNFMPPSGNLMAGNYTGAPFPGEYTDYNQTECNYTNHKYDDLKMRGNPPVFQQDKVPHNYKSGRREAMTKHKMECSKKESSKKYPNKKAKLNAEIEDWSDAAHMLWPNKAPAKKHSNLVMEETPFPNYVSNQVPQYQPEFFNSHLMSSTVQAVGSNVDRSQATFPPTSRANFNLSTIFPEITMKVQ